MVHANGATKLRNDAHAWVYLEMLGGVIFFTLVPGSGSFQLSGLAGLCYG